MNAIRQVIRFFSPPSPVLLYEKDQKGCALMDKSLGGGLEEERQQRQTLITLMDINIERLLNLLEKSVLFQFFRC